MSSRETISLVLGSGGARGMAHIGVIHCLEEHEYSIQSVSGSSMGALVGGIYAAGKLDEFADWLRALDAFDIVKLLDLSVSKGGLVEGDRIINTLKELVGDRMIEDLPIRFTAVAADISKEKEIWINSGPLFDAIRASISLPLFFSPFEHRGTKLLDGGILNPVPIAPTFDDGTDITVAVNLGGKPVSAPATPAKPSPKAKEGDGFREKIGRFIDELKDSNPLSQNGNWDMFDIANQTFDAMQGSIARQKLAAYPPDYVIELPRNACRTLEFDRADEMIQLGYDAALARLQLETN